MADYILDPDERIVERVNRYWVDLLPVSISGGLIVAVVFAGMLAYSTLGNQLPAFITPGIVLALAAVMIVIVILMLLSALYVYVHNYIIISNHHLIKVQQSGLFARQTAELGLGNIEDVKGGRAGVLGTLLDFGDIEIQTAGASENFIFRTVHHPQLIADRLLQYKEEFRHRHPKE